MKLVFIRRVVIIPGSFIHLPIACGSILVRPSSITPYFLHLFKHPPLLLQDLSLLADQRPLLLAEEPLQLPDLLLLALQGLHQLLLVLGELQL